MGKHHDSSDIFQSAHSTPRQPDQRRRATKTAVLASLARTTGWVGALIVGLALLAAARTTEAAPVAEPGYLGYGGYPFSSDLKNFILIRTPNGFALRRPYQAVTAQDYPESEEEEEEETPDPESFEEDEEDPADYPMVRAPAKASRLYRQRRLLPAESNFQLRVRKRAYPSAERNFQLRVRKQYPSAERNFQLRVRKSPSAERNFQLRVRKSDPNLRVERSFPSAERNFQLRVRKDFPSAERNFQLRVRKAFADRVRKEYPRAERNFQLRVRKDFPSAERNFQLRVRKDFPSAERNFQLRVRKDFPSAERNFQLRVRKDYPSAERNFQLRVRKSDHNPYPSRELRTPAYRAESNFQLRVRKDGHEMDHESFDEPQYFDDDVMNSGVVKRSSEDEVPDFGSSRGLEHEEEKQEDENN